MLNINIYCDNQSVLERAQYHMNNGKSQHLLKTQYYEIVTFK